MRRKEGIADNGTGVLRVHRWIRVSLDLHLSRCGTMSTRTITPHPSGIKCKRCFKENPTP